ncbi:trypsin-like peptidase domain-containing protein [Hyalangium sp.]|uniref:trypsin-like peptidase domain-containing protein n=1 Tax=Hyalangium sp. TaxID=2028555 RepID=UPI002D33BBAD|nr:trypsin-like peptidase domain-containing protein [Hyalangium sp.]HYH98888.1 trypsin-like peptidase domain-containing protein [Hyalangium sp.]
MDAGRPSTPAARETLELGVTNTSLYPYAGTMDFENRYASTVMITTGSQPRAVRCSGVLISPRVVLTAGSCLCEPRKSATPASKEESLGSGASCLERASVTTVTYGTVLDKAFPEETTPMRFDSYEGEVRPHPEFKPLSEDSGPAKPGHADLAVIVLDEAVKSVPPETLMEQGELQVHESLVMAGYAHDGNSQAVGGLYGVRYFRKNTVAQVLAPEEGRVLYQQQGPSLYNGYAGGPCFREEAQRRLLVGIASIGSDQELSFTSVSPFRDWLRAEVRRAAAPTPPAPNH